MSPREIPSFVAHGTFSWDALDYNYSETPTIDLSAVEALASQEPWIRLTAILERAKGGDHSRILELESMIFAEDPSSPLTRAVLDVIGTAGTTRNLEILARIMSSGEPYLTMESCRAASCAGTLWLVPHVVIAWRRAKSYSERETIRMRLASVLEDWDGPIGSGEVDSDDEFARTVQQRMEELLAIGVAGQSSFLLGRPYNPGTFANYMLELARSGIDRQTLTPMFYLLRHRFESSTGIACSAFFKNGEFQPLSAAAILEDFLGRPESARFEDGVRYFFGHRIPD